MEHLDARALASHALDEQLPEERERELALHLVSCADCKAFYDHIQHFRAVFRRIAPESATTDAVEAAIFRSTTVLGGEADPGADGGAEAELGSDGGEEPGSAPDASLTVVQPPIAIHTGVEDDTGPMDPVFGSEEDKPTPADEPTPADGPTPLDEPTSAEAPPLSVSEPEPVEPSPSVSEPEAVEPPPSVSEPEPDEPPPPTPEPEIEDPVVVEPPDPVVAPGAGPAMPPPIPPGEPVPDASEPPVAPRQGVRVGPWIAAMAVTFAIAVLAGVLFVSGPRLFEGPAPDLPPADQVRSRVAAAFDDLQSAKAGFTVTRLSLYRVRQDDDSFVYSFSNGTLTGRFVFEDPSHYREEVSLSVGDAVTQETAALKIPDELRMLTGRGDEARLAVTSNPPFGPPDGHLLHDLGVFEQTIGSAIRLLVDAHDLRVVDRDTHGEREVYRMAFSATPTAFTRADRIEVLVDTITFFPVQVRRSIERADAGVLGPPEVLDESALDQAFGDRQRLTTELVELQNVVLNDVILPGEFTLDAPEGAEVETFEGAFEPVSLTEADEALPFTPLYPDNLPQGYREHGAAVFTGEPEAWGPDGAYPAPDGILHLAYSDRRSTIVVTQRHFPNGAFTIDESPLQGPGLPLVTRHHVRAGRQFVYAISPEVPPHVFGFVGDAFVMVTGYAPQDDLLRIAASLATPTEAEAEPTED